MKLPRLSQKQDFVALIHTKRVGTVTNRAYPNDIKPPFFVFTLAADILPQ